jgi:hypothetical protein
MLSALDCSVFVGGGNARGILRIARVSVINKCGQYSADDLVFEHAGRAASLTTAQAAMTRREHL